MADLMRVSPLTIERWKERARVAITSRDWVEIDPRILMAILDDLSTLRATVVTAPPTPERETCKFCRAPTCDGNHPFNAIETPSPA